MTVMGREGNAVVVGGVDIIEGVEGGFHVVSGRSMIVGREEGVNGSKIRACVSGKPTNATDKTLVGFPVSNLSRRHIVGLGFRDGINM